MRSDFFKVEICPYSRGFLGMLRGVWMIGVSIYCPYDDTREEFIWFLEVSLWSFCEFLADSALVRRICFVERSLVRMAVCSSMLLLLSSYSFRGPSMRFT